MVTQDKLRDKLEDMLTSDDPKKRVKKYLLIVGTLIAVMVILAVHAGQSKTDSTDLVYTEDGVKTITLTGPEEMQVDIPTADLLQVDYISRIDFGTQLSGIETDNCYCGTFRNDVWGEYVLFAEKKVTDYIIFRVKDGMILFNCNSRRETEALYQALKEMDLGT